MASFRFLHVADVHLDSPLRGLEENPEAPVGRIREASRRAVENLVEFVLREAVPLVVIAGDLFDGDWRDYCTGHYLANQLGRLTREGVHVVVIRGNHDAESVLTRALPL
ncbi:MAG: metallophosphoesterase, partial [Acetobacteraceae bacterium]|nr:metallophosphoesterase [Acetobacteraceae bacterium]